jgi:prepilin-type N-terminal cleavage/methylation domain-containing protein
MPPSSHMNNRNLTTRTHGFTLMEVLAVIAIIGILASVTIANLGDVRKSTRDKYAMTSMQSMIIEASKYRANNGSYTGVCAGLATLISDVTTSSGITPVCHDTVTSGYEVQLTLLSGQTYCIDSNTFFGYITLPNPISNHDC